MVISSRQEKTVMFSNFVIEKINHASTVSKNRLLEGNKCKITYLVWNFATRFRECDDKELACMR